MSTRFFFIPIATMAIASMTGCDQPTQETPSADLEGVEPVAPKPLEPEDVPDPTATDPVMLPDVAPPQEGNDATDLNTADTDRSSRTY